MTNHDDEFEDQAKPHSFALQTDRSPKQIERQVLGLSNNVTADELAAAIDAAEWLVCRAKSIHGLCKQIAVAWIEHNGEFAVGDLHYSVGYQTTTRCTDPARCGEALLRAMGGDFATYMSALVAQPYKHGFVRGVLDTSAYRSFFTTRSTARLVNGVPERTLMRSNERFAK